MLTKILQHIDDRRAHLAGCVKCTGMVAVGPDSTASGRSAVDTAGAAAGEALKSPGEGAAIVGFDHEMKVVSLNGEVDDPEVGTIGPCERLVQDREDPFRSQGRQAAIRTKRD